MRPGSCFAMGLTLFLTAPVARSQVACTDLIGNGYIGIYADPSYTNPCATIPNFSSGTLYVVAKLEGASAAGISGAEFRLEFDSTAGYFLTWNAMADVPLGTPLPPANPNDPYGVNLAYSMCQPNPPGSSMHVLLGTISVFNAGGGPTAIRVKMKRPPGNPNAPFPRFTACDSPVFSRIPLTLPDWELGREGVAFIAGLNDPQCPSCPLPVPTAPLGLYADSTGAPGVLSIRANESKDFHLIGLVPQTTPAGITGAEFRIEVSDPAGFFFNYFPPSGASAFGSPFDLTPGDPNDPTGTTIFWPSCQPGAQPQAGDLVDFGRVRVFHVSGDSTQIRIRRKNPPGDPGMPCARFFLCDQPFLSPVCMNAPQGSDIVFETRLTLFQEPPFEMETLSLDTREADDGAAGPVATAQTLNSTKQFLITVQGNFSLWPSTSWVSPPNALCGVPDRSVQTPSPGVTNTWAGADAEVLFAVALPPGGDCGNLEALGYPRHPALFEMDFGAGFSHIEPLGLLPVDPAPGHLYRYLVQGQNAIARFRWRDTQTSDNYGILTIKVEETDATNIDIPVATRRIAMLGNVPDPFNPSTEIRYVLPEAGPVRLEIFDIRGRLVRRIFEGRQVAGLQAQNWNGLRDDGTQAPSGTYFARVKGAAGVGTERLTLVK